MNSIREEFAVTSLAMDLTKDLIATGCYSENKIHFWNVSNQTKVKTIRFDKAFNPINSILFFKNNIAFIANSAANAVILHGENFSEIQKLNRKENREIVAISHSKNNFMVACQRPLLQTLNGKIAEDIFIYDSNDWTLKQTVSSNSLILDAKVSNQLLLTIALDDQDGLFKLTMMDLTSSKVNTLELGNDAYTAQLATNDQSHIISVILRINNDEDGSMLNTLFIIDLNTKEIIYKNTVTNGDDYLNCQVINNSKLIIDFYDHAAQTSYVKLISSQGMELSKRKVNGITTYGIATTENLVALAVNNYVEFMELG